MSQSRITDYGSPVVAQTIKTLVGSIIRGAVLEGNDFIVISADRFQVQPGKAVTHQGVIIIEDEVKSLQIPNTTNATDYTIFYSHADADISGGVAAELVVSPGLLTGDVVSGVILGYVRYPGSAVPLSTSHFIQAPKIGVGLVTPTINNLDYLLPINGNYITTATTGSPLDLNSTFDISSAIPQMYLKIRNNTATPGTRTLTFPFKVYDRPYRKLQLVMGVDINATVAPIFIDSFGAATSLLVQPITGVPALNSYTINLPQDSIQTPNQLVYIQIQVAVASLREVKLQAIGLNDYNLPV